MTISYQDDLNSLIANGYISYVTILDPNGATYWTNNPNWQINGAELLGVWQSKAPSVNIAGTKYSAFLNDPPEFLVAKSMGGGGTVIIAKAPNGYFFLTWTDPSAQINPTNIHGEVARMAAKFR
ncbi:MAG: profilin family protein [Candidatus Hodarchaeales archaeon]|jgi:hypothetical protein